MIKIQFDEVEFKNDDPDVYLLLKGVEVAKIDERMVVYEWLTRQEEFEQVGKEGK